MIKKRPRRTKEQIEMDNTITEMTNTPEGINSTITEEEEWISDLEDRMVKISSTKQNKEKRIKTNEESLRDIWGNIQTIGVPEEEEREEA